ncbi:hypothetical protein [uncultured Sphingomonas sp.]|uniref:hypothetical protein n=1 Tax=uncultured Sphingomonas sp. TaxID=158754 RepID=UPI0035CB4940
MRMGIKEFRDRLGEVARGEEPVQLTDRGQVIGIYNPLPRWTPERRERALAAVEEIKVMQAELRASGIEPHDILAEMGLDPWGAPLEQADDP